MILQAAEQLQLILVKQQNTNKSIYLHLLTVLDN